AMVQCRNCGREMGAGAQWCPECGVPRERGVRCHACGNEFPSNLGKCHRCGAVGAAAYGPKYTRALIFGIVIVVLIFVALCVFGWYQHSRDVEEQRRWFEGQKVRTE